MQKDILQEGRLKFEWDEKKEQIKDKKQELKDKIFKKNR